MNELTKMIFKELGVEPNEWFKVESEIKSFVYEEYRIGENLLVYGRKAHKDRIGLSVFFPDIATFIQDPTLIKKIVKPLLTEEEKEFLKEMNASSVDVDGSFVYIRTFVTVMLPLKYLNIKFNGLEKCKEYTKEDLGL